MAGDRVWKQGPKEVRPCRLLASALASHARSCTRAHSATTQVWAAPLAGGARAVIMFNRHVGSDDNFPDTEMTFFWSQVGLPTETEVSAVVYVQQQTPCPCPSDHLLIACCVQATVRDLFKERNLGVFSGSFTSVVDNHGVIVLKISPTRQVAQKVFRPYAQVCHFTSGPALTKSVSMARPMVGLDAWRPWKCDPSLGEVCVEDSALEKMGASPTRLDASASSLPSSHVTYHQDGAACDPVLRRTGEATLQQQVSTEQARVAGLQQREAALQAAVGRLEAQAATDAANTAQRVLHLERLRAAESEAAQRACAQVRFHCGTPQRQVACDKLAERCGHPTSWAQAVDRKNLVVVLALGVASGCVLGFLAAAVVLQCSWAAATYVAAAGTPHGMSSPKLSGMISDDACSLAAWQCSVAVYA